jgi:arsenate reductase
VKRIHWPLDDPAVATGTETERLAVFRRIRDEIVERMRGFVAEYGQAREVS